MNILFVSECYPDENNPQYCIYLEQQAKALQELGHNVEVLVPEMRCDVLSQTEEKMYNNIKKYHVRIKRGKLSKIFPLYSLKTTLEKFHWKKYDVISIHLVSNGLCFRIVNMCNRLNIPTVIHFHGLNVWNDYYEKKGFLYRLFWIKEDQIKKAYLRKSSAFVGVSNKVCDVIKQRIKNKPIFTVYNGVDAERFKATKNEKNKNSFVVLCVANLIKLKGHEYLLKAVAKAVKEGREVCVNLIGVGSEEEALKKLCVECGIEKNVSFLGTCHYDVVAQYMNSADIFIMPSYFEALGCVYLEAMSSGTLTCGCFGTGAEEIIKDKESGILVAQKSVDDIYEAIVFAMDNPEEAKRIAKNGVNRAHDFSWSASACSLVDVYENLVYTEGKGK